MTVICTTNNTLDRVASTRVANLGTPWWRRRLAGLARAKGGSAVLEFALGAPLLIALLVPVVDFGIAYSEQIRVQNAAQAGAQYAILHLWSSASPAAISNAVLAASTVSMLTASPAPIQTCGCPSGSAVTLAPTCSSTCSDGQLAGYYVTVSAQAPYISVMPYTVLQQPMTLAAQSMVRIR
jgi:Flp pilus assembly protein TadG